MGQGCQIAGVITGAVAGTAVAGSGAFTAGTTAALSPAAMTAGKLLGTGVCEWVTDDAGNVVTASEFRAALAKAGAEYDAYFRQNEPPPPKPTAPRWLAPVGIGLGALLLGGIVFTLVRR